MPFITQIEAGEGLSLAVVKHYGDEAVIYLPPGRHSWVTSDQEMFLKVFKGIVLFGELDEGAGKLNNVTSLALEKRKYRKSIGGLLVFPSLAFIAICNPDIIYIAGHFGRHCQCSATLV